MLFFCETVSTVFLKPRTHFGRESLFHHWMKKCLIVWKFIHLTPKTSNSSIKFSTRKTLFPFSIGHSPLKNWHCLTWQQKWLQLEAVWFLLLVSCLPRCASLLLEGGEFPSLWVLWSCSCFVHDPLNFSSVVVSAWCKGCSQPGDEQDPLVFLWTFLIVSLSWERGSKVVQGGIWVAIALCGAGAQHWLLLSSQGHGQNVSICIAFHQRHRTHLPWKWVAMVLLVCEE